MSQHVIVGETCLNCGTCCGGTCDNVFASCRANCFPCCEDSVQFLPSLDLPQLEIVAKQTSTQKYGKYNPAASDGLEVPLGVLKHPVRTDADGRLVNFQNLLSFVPGCGQYVGVIFTSGEFAESKLANGDLTQVAYALAYPGFAKRIPNGYIRIA